MLTREITHAVRVVAGSTPADVAAGKDLGIVPMCVGVQVEKEMIHFSVVMQQNRGEGKTPLWFGFYFVGSSAAFHGQAIATASADTPLTAPMPMATLSAVLRASVEQSGGPPFLLLSSDNSRALWQLRVGAHVLALPLERAETFHNVPACPVLLHGSVMPLLFLSNADRNEMFPRHAQLDAAYSAFLHGMVEHVGARPWAVHALSRKEYFEMRAKSPDERTCMLAQAYENTLALKRGHVLTHVTLTSRKGLSVSVDYCTVDMSGASPALVGLGVAALLSTYPCKRRTDAVDMAKSAAELERASERLRAVLRVSDTKACVYNSFVARYKQKRVRKPTVVDTRAPAPAKATPASPATPKSPAAPPPAVAQSAVLRDPSIVSAKPAGAADPTMQRLATAVAQVLRTAAW